MSSWNDGRKVDSTSILKLMLTHMIAHCPDVQRMVELPIDVGILLIMRTNYPDMGTNNSTNCMLSKSKPLFISNH